VNRTIHGAEKEFYGSALWGSRLLCVYRWWGWENHPRW